MIEITNFRQGAIVNSHRGKETAQGITIRIEGISSSGRPVKVNGVPAVMEGRRFSADVTLSKKINEVTASALTPYGTFSQELTLLWDKGSFKRYQLFLDDHSFLFTDLAKQRPQRAFDHFYLAALKRIHDQYGMKVTLNCFYRNDHFDNFLMKDMPDTWKQEFIDNSSWLRFAPHAYSEFPDRPYLEASGEEFGRDYDLIRNEIIRFAGEESFIPPVVLHWGNVHPAVAAELVRRGATCYSGMFRPRVMGGPSLADRQKGGDMKRIEQRSVDGSDRNAGSEGFAMHYEHEEEMSYLAKNGAYFDPSLNVIFFRNVCCSNLTPLAEIPGICRKALDENAANGTDVISVGGHEQYSFPYYSNYLPDHLERLECLARIFIAENGYKPVFFSEGVLGNTAWGK